MSLDPLPFHAFDLDAETVRARVGWGRRQGHPHYVWPHVAPADWRRARHILAGVVGAVLQRTGGLLHGRRPDPVALKRPPGLSSQAVGVAAFTSGTGPLLGRWIEDDRVTTDNDVARLLDLHLRHGRARARSAERILGLTVNALREVGVEPVVLKGGHTGRVLFPEPGTRPAADLDILVPAARWDEAVEALDRAGFRRGTAKVEPPTLEMTPPGTSRKVRALDLAHAGNPFGLDVHGSLDRDFFRVGTARFGEPGIGDTAPLPDVDGARVLSQPLLTAFLATHACHGLHSLTLLRILELVAVIRDGGSTGTPDPEALHRCLDRAGALRFVLPALSLCEDLAPGTMDPVLLRRVRRASTPRTRRVVARLRPGGAPSLDRFRLEERLMWGRSPRDHLMRALDSLWPRSAGDSLTRRLAVWRDRLPLLGGRRGGGRRPGRGPSHDPDSRPG